MDAEVGVGLWFLWSFIVDAWIRGPLGTPDLTADLTLVAKGGFGEEVFRGLFRIAPGTGGLIFWTPVWVALHQLRGGAETLWRIPSDLVGGILFLKLWRVLHWDPARPELVFWRRAILVLAHPFLNVVYLLTIYGLSVSFAVIRKHIVRAAAMPKAAWVTSNGRQ